MNNELLQAVTDELCKHFKDPINKMCSYCEAAKAVIPLVRADTHQDTIDAMNDYTDGKISFERLAEVMDINYYELAAMVDKRGNR